MNVKNYLSQLGYYEDLVLMKNAEARHYMSLATTITVGSSNLGTVVQASDISDRTGNYISAMVDAQRQAEEILDKYIRLRLTIESQLEGLIEKDEEGNVIDSELYTILHLHFLQGVTFMDAADIMHRSLRSVFIIYKKALAKFDELYSPDH